MQNAGARVSVLVVDHQPAVIAMIVSMLQTIEQVEVLDAVDLPQLAIAKTYALEPDVIVYGFKSSGSNPFDYLRLIRPKLPQAYIIACSFVADQEDRAASLAAGADDYVNGYELATDLLPRILTHQRRAAG